MQQNNRKTALKISKTDFYFVTCFYSLYDICMADIMFNNVNSSLKIVLCQPNKVVFKVKVLLLYHLNPYRKP